MGVSTHNQLPLCCHIYDWNIRLPRLESDSDIIKLHLVMLILTLSMNIHIIVRFRQIYSSSKGNKYEAIKLTTERMIWPCLYTALTTIVAFASLIFSDIKPVIDFGYMMVLGLLHYF